MTTTATFDEARIARLHLRLGMLALAHAELEDLGARGALDTAGLASLAEARWRAGDLIGAGVAAQASMDAGGEDPVAMVVAAEAAAASGRPSDARRLAARLADLDAEALDAIFRGMPHRAFWPAAPGGTGETEPLFGPGAAPAGGAAGHAGDAAGDDAVRRAEPHHRRDAVEPSLWSDVPGARDEAAAAGRAPLAARGGRSHATAHGHAHEAGHHLHADPAAELARARDELKLDTERACLRLALVLRSDPALAPAVLDALALRREPIAAVVRGDAHRVLGHHLEAEAAFAQASASLEREP